MLPKKERFTKVDFLGKRPKVFFRGTFFDAAQCDLATQKFACVTSKKTLKKAVDRNCVKRKLLQGVEDFKGKNPHSIIFYPKKGSGTTPYSALYEEIRKAFATLK